GQPGRLPLIAGPRPCGGPGTETGAVETARPATRAVCTLSLRDALPICRDHGQGPAVVGAVGVGAVAEQLAAVAPQPASCSATAPDRKSTRLNSSHVKISYAVFCLKKKTLTAERRSRQRGQPQLRSSDAT